MKCEFASITAILIISDILENFIYSPEIMDEHPVMQDLTYFISLTIGKQILIFNEKLMNL